MAAIDISSTSAPLNDGILQLQNGVAMSSTLTPVTDQSNTASTLNLSTNSAQFTSALRITCDDPSDMYLDCEDGSANNRFSITRNTASQQVNLNFASNPVGSTTTVGAIRTYVDGVNLSEAMTFREDGNVGIGTTSPTYKFMVSDNSANDGAVFFEKDLLGSFSDVYAYNKNASTNLTTGQLVGQLSFGGYFNSTYNPIAQEFSAVQAYYMGTGTTRKGALRLSTHDGVNLQPAVIVDENQLVGIGQTTPTARLHVLGKGSTSATTALLVQNSVGTAALTILDSLNSTFGGTVTSDGGFRSIAYSDSFQRVALNNGINTIPQNYLLSGGAGRILLVDITEADFNRLQFGGTSASYPSLKRASNNLEVKNADDTYGAGLSVGAALNASAILQADSTTKGFLPPRMTNAERAAITTPAVGLMVYCTDAVEGLYIYKSTGWTFVI